MSASTGPDLSATPPTAASGIIVRLLEDGAVLFDPQTETYFGLNAVGAEIWALLAPVSATLSEVCDTLCRSYPEMSPAVIAADLQAVVDALVASGLATNADER